MGPKIVEWEVTSRKSEKLQSEREEIVGEIWLFLA